MSKNEIIEKLNQHYTEFIRYIDSLPEKDFNYNREDKWTAGQQLDHIILAVNPLTQGFILPAFAFGLIFGKSNRPGSSYDELVKKYHQKLAAGGRASSRFIPPSINYAQKQNLLKRLTTLISTLTRQVNKFSEKDLDTYILPHPLLGKLTIREMLYFTVYHVQHHQENIRTALAGK